MATRTSDLYAASTVNGAALMIVMAVGFRVREQRLARGLEAGTLASLAGLTPKELDDLENRRLSGLTFRHMDTLGRILNCSPEYLLGLRDQPQRDVEHTPLWIKLVDIGAATFWAMLAGLHLNVLWHQPSVLQAALAVYNLVIAYAFVRRRPAYLNPRLPQWLVAAAATLLPLVGFYPAVTGWKLGGTFIELVGLVLTAVGILTLGRAFGMAAANRGIVTGGLYQVVRHPLYASELLVLAGYVLGNTSLLSLVSLVLWGACMWLRIVFEERLLGVDDAYRAYREQVRWRVIPGVW